eukprot:m.251402 g.251402  ORF g.251402 m.251402 type:complete len:135 (+) comp40336_c0_seq8:488-892(+)
MLAVMFDALKECGLNEIAYDLVPILKQMEGNSAKEFQGQKVLVNREIMNVVSRFGKEGTIPSFGRELLNATAAEVENVIAGITKPFEKMFIIVDTWKRKNGNGATLEKLLSACDHPSVAIRGGVEAELQSAGLL